jgi:hypothetical protein
MSTAPLIEGLDYYLENGLMVFTTHYLRNRGHCCESGCRHCPYGFKKLEEQPAGSE